MSMSLNLSSGLWTSKALSRWVDFLLNSQDWTEARQPSLGTSGMPQHNTLIFRYLSAPGSFFYFCISPFIAIRLYMHRQKRDRESSLSMRSKFLLISERIERSKDHPHTSVLESPFCFNEAHSFTATEMVWVRWSCLGHKHIYFQISKESFCFCQLKGLKWCEWWCSPYLKIYFGKWHFDLLSIYHNFFVSLKKTIRVLKYQSCASFLLCKDHNTYW